MQWSTQSAAAFSDVKISLDERGHIAAYEIDHYQPAMQDDRLIGAVLAGLPTMPAPGPKGGMINNIANGSSDQWLYDSVANLDERCHGTFQVGQQKSPLAIGLRDHSMRTPGQFQQNFPREMAMNEAAALAGADPLQFRIDHATDERLLNVLQHLKAESGWENRRTPNPEAVRPGQPLCAARACRPCRPGTDWACACDVTVVPATGVIKLEKYTVVLDPGIVVNPEQLKRQVEGGAVMGISIALHEEVNFNESAVTTANWSSYPIATMAEIPEIKVVMLHRPEVGSYGQGSEAANALAASAIASAVFDATGKAMQRMPLRPAHVMEMLKA